MTNSKCEKMTGVGGFFKDVSSEFVKKLGTIFCINAGILIMFVWLAFLSTISPAVNEFFQLMKNIVDHSFMLVLKFLFVGVLGFLFSALFLLSFQSLLRKLRNFNEIIYRISMGLIIICSVFVAYAIVDGSNIVDMWALRMVDLIVYR